MNVHDLPVGVAFHWNPYSPKFYTIVNANAHQLSSMVLADGRPTTPSLNSPSSHSDNEGSVGGFDESTFTPPRFLEDEEYDLAWATINQLRVGERTTDAMLQATIQRFPIKTVSIMLAALESSPTMIMELCERERGNIVWQLMAVLGGKQCAEFVRFALCNAQHLATNQSGCIAFTRIYDAATVEQQREMAKWALTNFADLCMHPYGNYVIQRVLQHAALEVYTVVTSIMINMTPAAFVQMCGNKFGSHVIETYIKHCPADIELAGFRDVCSMIFHDEVLSVLAFDKMGNYVVQNALKAIMSRLGSADPLAQWCMRAIPAKVDGSQFAPNINRALGFGATTSTQSRSADEDGHHAKRGGLGSKQNSMRRTPNSPMMA
jgi:hypothetical protein